MIFPLDRSIDRRLLGVLEHASDRTKTAEALSETPRYLTLAYITFIVFGVSARRPARSVTRLRIERQPLAVSASIRRDRCPRRRGFREWAFSRFSSPRSQRPMISARFGGSELLLSVGGRVGNAGEHDATRREISSLEIRAVFADRSRRNELRRAKFEGSLLPLPPLSPLPSPVSHEPTQYRSRRMHRASLSRARKRGGSHAQLSIRFDSMLADAQRWHRRDYPGLSRFRRSRNEKRGWEGIYATLSAGRDDRVADERLLSAERTFCASTRRLIVFDSSVTDLSLSLAR